MDFFGLVRDEGRRRLRTSSALVRQHAPIPAADLRSAGLGGRNEVRETGAPVPVRAVVVPAEILPESTASVSSSHRGSRPLRDGQYAARMPGMAMAAAAGNLAGLSLGTYTAHRRQHAQPHSHPSAVTLRGLARPSLPYSPRSRLRRLPEVWLRVRPAVFALLRLLAAARLCDCMPTTTYLAMAT